MKHLFTWIIILCSIGASAQEFRATIAPTICNDYFHFAKDNIAVYPKYGLDVSIDYLLPKTKKHSFGFGLSYQHVQIETKVISPFDVTEPRLYSFNIISGNFKFIRNFKWDSYFSLNPLLYLEIPGIVQDWSDMQTGLGISFNIGKNFNINEHFALVLEPMISLHNILPFVEEPGTIRRKSVMGIKCGISLK